MPTSVEVRDPILVDSSICIDLLHGSHGTVLPMADIVIACCASRAGTAIVSKDPHFKLIQRLRVMKELMIR